MLSTLSIITLSIFIIVVLNSESDHFNISAISGSGACSTYSIFFFFGLLLHLAIFFLVAGHNVPGERNCYKWTFTNVMERWEEWGHILVSYD